VKPQIGLFYGDLSRTVVTWQGFGDQRTARLWSEEVREP